MDLDLLATEIGARLDTIDELTVYVGPPASIHEPCAVVALPDEIEYDRTFGRGADRIVLPVLVLVSRVDDASIMKRAAAYCAGSGASSVKAILQDNSYTWQQCDYVFVARAELDTVTWGGLDYQGVLFELHILGPGS